MSLNAYLASMPIDALRDRLKHDLGSPVWVVGTATGLTTAFTVGYVMWCLRAGYLVAGAASAIPLWTSFDPLPILDHVEKDPGRDERETDEESRDDARVESLLT
jgi:hypothetical protein